MWLFWTSQIVRKPGGGVAWEKVEMVSKNNNSNNYYEEEKEEEPKGLRAKKNLQASNN